MQERTLEQERKGLEQGVCNYLCLSAAKKLSKTITFLDKKWSSSAANTLPGSANTANFTTFTSFLANFENFSKGFQLF